MLFASSVIWLLIIISVLIICIIFITLFILQKNDNKNILRRVLGSEILSPVKPVKLISNRLLKNTQHRLYMHVCLIGSWYSVVDKMLKKCVSSGLMQELSDVYIVVVGASKHKLDMFRKLIAQYPKCMIRDVHEKANLYERATLSLIHNDSLVENFNVLYVHSKGVTKKCSLEKVLIQQWVDMMLYFLMTRYQQCFEILDSADTCGVNLLDKPKHHYSGNFWWATSQHIRTLSAIINEDYFAPEMWVGSNPHTKMISMYQSNINHYFTPCHASNYKENALLLTSLKPLSVKVERINMFMNNISDKPLTKFTVLQLSCKVFGLMNMYMSFVHCLRQSSVHCKTVYVLPIHNDIFSQNLVCASTLFDFKKISKLYQCQVLDITKIEDITTNKNEVTLLKGYNDFNDLKMTLPFHPDIYQHCSEYYDSIHNMSEYKNVGVIHLKIGIDSFNHYANIHNMPVEDYEFQIISIYEKVILANFDETYLVYVCSPLLSHPLISLLQLTCGKLCLNDKIPNQREMNAAADITMVTKYFNQADVAILNFNMMDNSGSSFSGWLYYHSNFKKVVCINQDKKNINEFVNL